MVKKGLKKVRLKVVVFSVFDDSDHKHLPRQGFSDSVSLIVLVIQCAKR